MQSPSLENFHGHEAAITMSVPASLAARCMSIPHFQVHVRESLPCIIDTRVLTYLMLR